MTTRRTFLTHAVFGAATAAIPGLAMAAYPDRPIKLILPYAAGGASDSFARIVSSKLEKVLGQPVVADYRIGATGTVAAEATARAPADGYTIHVIDSGAFAYVPNMRKLNYDPLKSLVPVAPLGVVPMILVANPAVPIRNMHELVAYAKANPGKLNCASAGVGSAHHLIAEFLKLRTGIDMKHVAYKGAAQYMTDLVGGQVDLAVSSLAPAIPFLENGRVRAVGVTTAKRASALPDVPTIAEQGMAGFDEKPWNCFVGPAGIPADVLEHLRSAFRKVYEDAEVVAALQKAGLEDVGAMTPAQISEQMRVDLAKWGEVIRQAKITMDS